MPSWRQLFGPTSIDESVNIESPAGDAWFQLESLVKKYSREAGWKTWRDKESGAISAVAPGVRIWQGASVRASLLCSDVVIGHCSEVIECIVLEGAKLNHFVAIGRSIVGPRSSLTAQVVVGSNRLDGNDVRLPNAYFSTAQSSKKFGSLVGRDVRVGAHTLLHPGTVVPPEVLVEPFSQWKGRE